MTLFQQIFPLTGLSISEGAHYLRVDKRRIQEWKNGQSEPRADDILKLEQLRQAIELVAEGHDIVLNYQGAEKEAEREYLRLQRKKERATT